MRFRRSLQEEENSTEFRESFQVSRTCIGTMNPKITITITMEGTIHGESRAASNLTVTCVHLFFCWFCGESNINAVGKLIIGNAKSGAESRVNPCGGVQGVCGEGFCRCAGGYDCAAGVDQQADALPLFRG